MITVAFSDEARYDMGMQSMMYRITISVDKLAYAMIEDIMRRMMILGESGPAVFLAAVLVPGFAGID